MSTTETALPYSFVHTENAIVNMHELLAVVTDKESGDAVLFFKNGQKVSVPEEVKTELVKVMDRL